MDFSIDTSNINMEAPIQDKSLPIKDIANFPSKQAEAIQKHLLELDKQGKLFDEFMSRYGNNLGKPNSIVNYILEDFENRKRLFIEWTGVEVCNDKHTIVAIGIKLNEITVGSNRKLLWKCSRCQHEWTTAVCKRTSKQKNGCPACGGKICIPGKNDLETFCKEHPEYQKLLTEFIGEDINGNKILPSEISRASNKEVWWKCSNPDCNHKWHSMAASRTRKKMQGCPACAGNIIIKGKNDLETYCNQHPELTYILKEFVGIDENKQPILPSEVARGSIKKVLFECNKCHKRWIAAISDRTNHKSGCPYCNPIGTSFPEQFIYHSLKQLFPDTLSRAKEPIHNFEYDITIPSLRLCIEYSGYSWHADKLDRDQAKADHCKESKVNFLQIYVHNGEITDEQGLPIEDSYEKS